MVYTQIVPSGATGVMTALGTVWSSDEVEVRGHRANATPVHGGVAGTVRLGGGDVETDRRHTRSRQTVTAQ